MAKVAFTAGRVAGFKCPSDKAQAFLWDATAPGLGLRVTPRGDPSYVFQSTFQSKTLRMVVGSPSAWAISDAQRKARELQRLIDEGRDPRQVKAASIAADIEQRESDRRSAITVGEAWAAYMEARRPHWGRRSYDDHVKLSQVGGEKRRNRPGVLTAPGPLASLMGMPLRDLDAAAVLAWTTKEAPAHPARVRLALRLLKAFLRWCGEEESFKESAHVGAVGSKKIREAAGKPAKTKIRLQREQLGPWFDSVRRIPNTVISAYLQCLLLTGRRREQVMALRWRDVDFQWKTITMQDKIEGEVMVPLTPYMAHLMQGLPRRNEWVFSSTKTLKLDKKNAHRREQRRDAADAAVRIGDDEFRSASGRLVEPSDAHRKACAAAGINGLTLHGLRGSFASLSEWIDTPKGIAAQVQGHAPQGTRDADYIRREVDLLRMWHEKIERWMLEKAGVQFDANTTPGGLHVVAA